MTPKELSSDDSWSDDEDYYSKEKLGIPENAINLTPRPTTCHVYYLPDKDMVLKVGRFVRRQEAETLKFLKSRTSVPVPEVYDCYKKNGVTYIYMSKVEGKTLGSVWAELSEETMAKVASQLRRYIHEWQSLTSDFYGTVIHGPCEEAFFTHNSMRSPDKINPKYGPYSSREEYNAGLLEALANSRPIGIRDKRQELAEEKIRALEGEQKVFSHGDLHMDNIMVNDSIDITGIIDWDTACFSIPEREFFEMRNRAITPSWIKAIESIFSDDEKENYDTLDAINAELVLYSGI
ncbi:hypothetical protein TWF696_009763 [Orbilia brochopaga]|uniref:Aminoglycoside phosphotransferase domain-containing protein n=1 Tax=Orbilia brochopaga TaxID=3140254 RepID=A0AAV9UGJ7_9PEZI